MPVNPVFTVRVSEGMALSELVKDAEIFAPMVPLLESTRGIVTAEHINALPKGV